MTDHDNDNILEKNVSSLLETSGDAPRMTDVARARIKAPGSSPSTRAIAAARPRSRSAPASPRSPRQPRSPPSS